jgi:two-component system invasion response regulator UvrY
MIKVLVVGDASIMLQGVKQVLADSVDIVPVLESRMGVEALEKVHVHSLMDAVVVVLSEGSGEIESMLKAIHVRRPELPVLFVGSPEAGLPHLDGRSGWLDKNSSPQELVAEIRRVVRYATAYTDSRPQELTVGVARATDERSRVHAED